MYAPTVVSIKLDSRSRDRISADALQHAIPATNETRFRALFFVAQDRILHDRCLLIEVPGGFFFAELEESVARYLSQLDTADRQEPTEALAAKVTRLTEKLTKLKEEMGKLAVYEKQMLASPDQQISLTDPDSRSMATSGRGSGVVGYNVQVAVDAEHHLIVAHEVTNSGSDRAQLANIASQAKEILGVDELEAVADRGYFSGEEILACDKAGIAVTLPKPMTSGIEARGRFGKQDFVYLGDEDVYRCPAGEKLKYYY